MIAIKLASTKVDHCADTCLKQRFTATNEQVLGVTFKVQQ